MEGAAGPGGIGVRLGAAGRVLVARDAGGRPQHVFALRGGGIPASAGPAERVSDAAPVGDGDGAGSVDESRAVVRRRRVWAEREAGSLSVGDVLRIGIWAAVLVGAFVWLVAR